MRVPKLRVGPFSVPELIVVGIILMILASSANPRPGRAAAEIHAAALAGNLTILRNGLDLYARDHNGAFPSVHNFDAQMTQYTDAQGNTAESRDAAHTFGPYLRKVPLLPIGPKGHRGASAVLDARATNLGAAPGAWVYDSKTGEIRANLPQQLADTSGMQYAAY
jgi:hypothetical protein